MRVLVINPTNSMLGRLQGLAIDYEVVKNAKTLSEKFTGHNDHFDGVIAPTNPNSVTMRDIGENWHVKQRELPVFVFGNRVATKERLCYLNPSRFTFAYCGSLTKALRDWCMKVTESA